MTNSASSPNPSRQEAVGALYSAFAAPTPAIIEGCPCCIETRGVDVLLTTPLREIPGTDLWRYVSGAFLTVGGERDFRYLLPRIFDVAMNCSHESNDPEIVVGKLRLAGWENWTRPEREAVTQFIDGWFDKTIEETLALQREGWGSSMEVESLLCGIARADLPLGRWLKRLDIPRAEAIVRNLRDSLGERPSGFWKDAPKGFEELRSFLKSRQA